MPAAFDVQARQTVVGWQQHECWGQRWGLHCGSVELRAGAASTGAKKIAGIGSRRSCQLMVARDNVWKAVPGAAEEMFRANR